MSNQGGLGLAADSKSAKSEAKRVSDFKARVNYVLSQLDIHITLYAATALDNFRKPRTGMWHEILDEYDPDVDGPFDLEGSIFVGDAGGRTAQASDKTTKDFASSDR